MQLKLVKKVDEAKGTRSFFWEPGEKVEWLPGQYFYFTLPKLNYLDPRGTTRHFTISSSPTEGSLSEGGTLRLTTRIRQESGYKKTLDELAIGSVIEGEGPNGTLTMLNDKSYDQGSRSLLNVFIAGGIGITPFRSMIKYNIDRDLKIPMYLIYSNSDSDFVFKKELDEWQKENDYIKVVYFDSSVSGHLDAVQIRKIFDIWHLSFEIPAIWWLVGPPPFTDAVEDIFEKMKIPSDQIRSEKFTGY